MRVVMKVVLQTDSQMRKYKQTKRLKKGKWRSKMQMRQKEDTSGNWTILGFSYSAIRWLSSFCDFCAATKDGKKRDETPDRRLIYIYGHTTAKNPMTQNERACYIASLWKCLIENLLGAKYSCFAFQWNHSLFTTKTILIHPLFGLMTSVCKGINHSKGCITLVGKIIGVNPCFEVVLFSLYSPLLKGLFDGC